MSTRTFFCFAFLLGVVVGLLYPHLVVAQSPEVPPVESSGKEKDTEQAKKPARKSTPQFALLGSKVIYAAPQRWGRPKTSKREKVEAAQFSIPLPGKTARSTSAILVAEPNTDKLTVTDFSDKKIPKTYPASTVIGDQHDGDSWRTVVSHVHSATPPYTIVDRFGVAAGLRVHLRVILPAEEEAKATWPKLVAKESNAFIQSLKIANKNTVAAELFYDAGKWGVHETKGAKKTTAQEAEKKTSSAKKRPTQAPGVIAPKTETAPRSAPTQRATQ